MSTRNEHVRSREALRDMLIRLQHDTRLKIEDFRRDQRQDSESGRGDSIDFARMTEEVETHASLISGAEEKLRYLDEALVRLEQGKYGRCLSCDRPIPIERLRAVPFAAYCVDCQERRKHDRPDWAEGSMIQPYDHQWTIPEEMEEPSPREYHSTAVEEQLTIEGPLVESVTKIEGGANKEPVILRRRNLRKPKEIVRSRNRL